MSEGNSKSARDKAKAARLAAEAANKRRERLIRILGAGVVVIIVAAIIVAALVTSNKGGGNTGPTANPSAQLPNDVNSTTYAYQVTKSPAAGIPLVQIWEDFQCPACKAYEGTFAPSIYAAAAAGTINLQLRPTTFLDGNFPQSNNTSARATSAWGCAIDAGKPLEFHSAVFTAQPTPEGTPVSEAQFIEIGKQAGISGPAFDSFSSCVNAKTFESWAANSFQIFEQDKVPGTPTIYVNGKELPLKGISTPDQLLAKIKTMAA